MPSDSELRIESIAGIPLYDGDDESAHGVPDLVSRLRDAITAADGLLLVTPEYNNSILHGAEMIAKVITGIQFKNGVEVQKKDRQKIAA